MQGGNFHPDYVKINPNGTIPSLTSSSLKEPLIESADILEYLNQTRPSGVDLAPKDGATARTTEQLMDLVHSQEVSTDILLISARDPQEMKTKKEGWFKGFLATRQAVLDENSKQFPDSEFYKGRRDGNASVYKHYISAEHHDEFFKSSQEQYRGWAVGMDKLESLIVLPYATGPDLTYADIHMAAWIAHAMWGADGQKIDDFDPLENLIRKTVPDFRIGTKTKQWWANVMQRDAFKKVFPNLH